MGGLFINELGTDPAHYLCVLTTVVLSVTLHELGHVGAALRQGDETPRLLGRVTLDPLVHMGPQSLLMAALMGIAWGVTPVQPANFRGRHGEAFVAFAGPAVNLLLALTSLTSLGLWLHGSGATSMALAPGERHLLPYFLLVFGSTNMMLFLFNMVPVPPLDGSTVLADFAPGFRRLRHQPEMQPWFWAGLIAVVVLLPVHETALRLSLEYVRFWW